LSSSSSSVSPSSFLSSPYFLLSFTYPSFLPSPPSVLPVTD
jgi:hypothetical protein